MTNGRNRIAKTITGSKARKENTKQLEMLLYIALAGRRGLGSIMKIITIIIILLIPFQRAITTKVKLYTDVNIFV